MGRTRAPGALSSRALPDRLDQPLSPVHYKTFLLPRVACFPAPASLAFLAIPVFFVRDLQLSFVATAYLHVHSHALDLAWEGGDRSLDRETLGQASLEAVREERGRECERGGRRGQGGGGKRVWEEGGDRENGRRGARRRRERERERMGRDGTGTGGEERVYQP
jgi:hypothetical protein